MGHNVLPSYLCLARIEKQAFVVVYTNSDLIAVIPVLLKVSFPEVVKLANTFFIKEIRSEDVCI